MLKKKFDKSKLPSRHVTEGPARAPHRAYSHAMRMTDAALPTTRSPSGAKATPS
mgnify:CR=1 FL=1